MNHVNTEILNKARGVIGKTSRSMIFVSQTKLPENIFRLSNAMRENDPGSFT